MAENKQTIDTKVINAISNTISNIVKHLPNNSGDALNFSADLLAVGALYLLYNTGMLNSSELIISFIITLVFIMFCFIGTLFMRHVTNKEEN